MIIVEAGPPDYFPTTPSSLDYAPEKTGQLPHTPANELQGEDGNSLCELGLLSITFADPP